MEKYGKWGGTAQTFLPFGWRLTRLPPLGRGAVHSEGQALHLIKPAGWFSNLDHFCSLAPISGLKPSLRGVLILTRDWGESGGNRRYQTLNVLVLFFLFILVFAKLTQLNNVLLHIWYRRHGEQMYWTFYDEITSLVSLEPPLKWSPLHHHHISC